MWQYTAITKKGNQPADVIAAKYQILFCIELLISCNYFVIQTSILEGKIVTAN